jgi:catechol 2,3-dioxygenase
VTPSLCKLAHVALVTPDIDRSLWFFRDVLGMEQVETDGARTYLRCWGELDHHSISLREGPVGVEHIAFRASCDEDLDGFFESLRECAVDVEEVPRGEEAGQGDAIRFTMPHAEIPLELVWELERPTSPASFRGKLPTTSTMIWRQGVSPRRLDHVTVHTAADSVEAADAWAQRQLGFKRREYVQLSDRPMLVTFLAVTPQVHDLAISTDAEGRTGRFSHLALALEDAPAILRAADIMREHEIPVDLAPGRHGIAQSFFHYVRDPGSGHRVELCSGGYVVYDPDWEPIHWDERTIDVALTFFGPPIGMGQDAFGSTPCVSVAEVEEVRS